jgi:mediator of RNA polymerase II transcription subunit 9
MVLRYLFNYFANNHQLIEKLSDSYPVRRAARLTVYLYHKGKTVGDGIVQDNLKKGAERLNSFHGRFKEELKQGMKEIKDTRKR